jgi:SAM-dependent methyltransferase
VGKKSRNKKHRAAVLGEPRLPITPQQAVSSFLTRISAPGTQPTLGAFWDWFDELYGESAYRLSDVLDDKIQDNKFGARAETLRMSIDHQFGCSGDMVRSVMKAIARRLNDREVRTVADIGCGNGLHGCFAAWLCGAGLIAFDIDERNVRAANELASLVGVDHQIRQGDMLEDEWPIAGEDADVTLSVASVGWVKAPAHESSEAHLIHILDHVRRALSPGGLYMAVERLPDAERCHDFTQAAASCGLALDLAASEYLTVEEVPERVERIPLLVFVQSGDAHGPSLGDLRALYEQSTRPVRSL